jgi:hypothetical protein
MDEARAVLARLERIEALDRAGAPARTMIDELRALVVEAEAWVRAEPAPADSAEAAIERLRVALERPLAGLQEHGRTLLA